MGYFFEILYLAGAAVMAFGYWLGLMFWRSRSGNLS